MTSANEPPFNSGADAEQPPRCGRCGAEPVRVGNVWVLEHLETCADAEQPRASDHEAVRFAMRMCIEHGIDPWSIMVDELRAMGYTVTPPDAEQPSASEALQQGRAERAPDWERFGLVDDPFPGPLYRLCDDDTCRYNRGADPPRVHYHWTGADAEQGGRS